MASSSSSLCSSSTMASTSSRDRSASKEPDGSQQDGGETHHGHPVSVEEAQAQPANAGVWSRLTAPFHAIGGWLWNKNESGPRSFQEAFDREYCRASSVRPTFLDRTFPQAVHLARTEFKLLLVYLHCADHQNTKAFCGDVLCSDGLKMIVEEHFLFWACDISTKDGLMRRNQFEVTTYPFMAALMCTKSRSTMVFKMEGLHDVNWLIAHLHDVLERYVPLLISEKADHDAQILRRVQLEEQDRAYQEALRRDREIEEEKQRKLREQQEHEERRQHEEEQARARLERRKALKVARMQSLPPEPDQSALADCRVALIRFKFPSGHQLQHRFRETDSLRTVYDFVFAQDDAILPEKEWNEPDEYAFTLVTPYPRKVLAMDQSVTVGEAGLCPQAMLLVS